MKGVLPVVVILILVVAVGSFLFLNQSKTQTSTPPLEVSQNQNTTPVVGDSDKYLMFDNGTLEKTMDKRRVLFFYASWCPTCRPADANLTQNESKIPQDVVVIRVNYNDPDTDEQEKALAKRYGVTYQHTFVQIDENGNTVTKWNGGQIEELLENIK